MSGKKRRRKKRRHKKEKQASSGRSQIASQPATSGIDRSGWIPNPAVGLALLLISAIFGLLKEWRILIGLAAGGLTLLCWVAASLWCRRRKFLVFASLSAIVWLFASYWIIHPPFLETEVHGLLVPANEQDPKTNCPRVPSNAVLILLGNMPVYATKFPHRVISVDKDEVLLSIDRKEKGIAVSARVFSEDGKIVAEIINNEFFLNTSNYFRRVRPDKHTLVVYNLAGEEVLSVRYLNKRTVRLLAHFRHPSGAEVNITENGVHAIEPTMDARIPDLTIEQYYPASECRVDAKVDIPLHTHKQFRALFEEQDRIEQMDDPELERKAMEDWNKRFWEALKKDMKGDW